MVKDINLFPNIRTIMVAYFAFHHYMKGVFPFSAWWLVLIFGFDLIIAILMTTASDKFVAIIKASKK